MSVAPPNVEAMADIEIRPATADRFDDAEHALSGGGDGRSCQCQWWTITNARWQETSSAEREQLLRAEIESGPPPALIAYADGEPAAWVRIGPRTRQVRLARTRLLAADATKPWDDERIWAVTCFVVRKEHRGEGLNARLLDAAVDHARAHGAHVVEGYPVDPAGARQKRSNELFYGVLSTFAGAGFREIARPRPDRVIVALDLTA